MGRPPKRAYAEARDLLQLRQSQTDLFFWGAGEDKCFHCMPHGSCRLLRLTLHS
jgi:hypothetical protein